LGSAGAGGCFRLADHPRLADAAGARSLDRRGGGPGAGDHPRRHALLRTARLHDTALRAASNARAEIYGRLAQPTATAARLSGGELAGRLGADVDEVSDVLVRAILPIAVAAVLSIAAVAGIAMISAPAAAALAGCLLAGVGAPWLSARAATRDERAARLQHAGRDDATMLALDHAAELRVSGRLPIVIAEAARHQRIGPGDRPGGHPRGVRRRRPVAAVGISVLGAASPVSRCPPRPP
jgi:ATP-binding cassette subfamily C protein CydC